jgi:hypothetical protein
MKERTSEDEGDMDGPMEKVIHIHKGGLSTFLF